MVLEPEYKKSSYSGNGGCVEVGLTPEVIYLRDAKNPDKPPQEFTPREWQAFLDGAKAGEFDLA